MKQEPLDDEPANRPETTRTMFGAPVIFDRHEDTSTALENRQQCAPFQRETFILVDSLIGGHPIGVPCWMGFPTRFENLVSRGFDTEGLVFLGSDMEDYVCGFRGITTLSSSAR